MRDFNMTEEARVRCSNRYDETRLVEETETMKKEGNLVDG